VQRKKNGQDLQRAILDRSRPGTEPGPHHGVLQVLTGIWVLKTRPRPGCGGWAWGPEPRFLGPPAEFLLDSPISDNFHHLRVFFPNLFFFQIKYFLLWNCNDFYFVSVLSVIHALVPCQIILWDMSKKTTVMAPGYFPACHRQPLSNLLANYFYICFMSVNTLHILLPLKFAITV
jgi:hypothetical protein